MHTCEDVPGLSAPPLPVGGSGTPSTGGSSREPRLDTAEQAQTMSHGDGEFGQMPLCEQLLWVAVPWSGISLGPEWYGPLQTETLLSSVRLLSLLGKGGYSTTMRATLSGDEVALKIFNVLAYKDAKEVAHLAMEISVAPQLEHPNIVRTHGTDRKSVV